MGHANTGGGQGGYGGRLLPAPSPSEAADISTRQLLNSPLRLLPLQCDLGARHGISPAMRWYQQLGSNVGADGSGSRVSFLPQHIPNSNLGTCTVPAACGLPITVHALYTTATQGLQTPTGAPGGGCEATDLLESGSARPRSDSGTPRRSPAAGCAPGCCCCGFGPGHDAVDTTSLAARDLGSEHQRAPNTAIFASRRRRRAPLMLTMKALIRLPPPSRACSGARTARGSLPRPGASRPCRSHRAGILQARHQRATTAGCGRRPRGASRARGRGTRAAGSRACA